MELELSEGQKIISIITIDSVNRIGLEVGREAYAMINASGVMMAVD